MDQDQLPKLQATIKLTVSPKHDHLVYGVTHRFFRAKICPEIVRTHLHLEPVLGGCSQLPAGWYDVKFYPYTPADIPPVFAIVGGYYARAISYPSCGHLLIGRRRSSVDATRMRARVSRFCVASPTMIRYVAFEYRIWRLKQPIHQCQ